MAQMTLTLWTMDCNICLLHHFKNLAPKLYQFAHATSLYTLSNLPLYTILGLVKHITKWHSTSSDGTALEQTGHLTPGDKKKLKQKE